MRYLITLFFVVTLASCGGDRPAAHDPLGFIQLAAAGNGLHDIADVELRVIEDGGDCTTSPTIMSAVLEADPLPASLAGGSEHRFATALFTVPAGSYTVCATPLKSDLTPSDVCNAASASSISVAAGVATEVLLWSQCSGPDSAVLDVVAGLNDKPVIADIDISPSKWIIQCQTAHVSLTVEDNNDDSLHYSWSVTAQPAGAVVALAINDEHLSFSTDTPGDYAIEIIVSDDDADAVLEFPIHVQDRPCTWLFGANAVVKDVAVDDDGSVIVYGSFTTGTFDIGLPPVPSVATDTDVVFKLDRSGEPIWARALGPAANARGSIAIDDAGDIIVSAMYEGAVDIGCGELPVNGVEDVYLAKLSGSDGACRWSFGMGGNDRDFVGDVAVSSGPSTSSSSDDTIIVGGRYESPTFEVPPIVLNNGTPTGGAYMVARASDGSPAWQHNFIHGQDIFDLDVTPNGNIVVGGALRSIHFPSSPAPIIVNAGIEAAHFVALMDPADGLAHWAVQSNRNVSGTLSAQPMRIAADPSGDVLLTLSLGDHETINLGTGTLAPLTETDVFVAKLSGADGSPLWIDQAPGQYSFFRRIDALPNGDAVVTGPLLGDFEGDQDSHFVASLTSAGGVQQWAWKGTASARGLSIHAGDVIFGLLGNPDLGDATPTLELLEYGSVRTIARLKP